MAGPKLGLSVCTPRPPTLISRVTSATRSRTKTSPVWFSSWATSESASDSKATSRPSALIVGATLGPSPIVPWGPTLTSTVCLRHPVPDEDVELIVGVAGGEVRRRRRERHVAAVGAEGRVVAVAVAFLPLARQAHPLGGAIEPGRRRRRPPRRWCRPTPALEAAEAKATYRPSALMAGVKLAPSASPPSTASEIRLGPPRSPPTAARATGGNAPRMRPGRQRAAQIGRSLSAPVRHVRPPCGSEAADATRSPVGRPRGCLCIWH